MKLTGILIAVGIFLGIIVIDDDNLEAPKLKQQKTQINSGQGIIDILDWEPDPDPTQGG